MSVISIVVVAILVIILMVIIIIFMVMVVFVLLLARLSICGVRDTLTFGSGTCTGRVRPESAVI